MLTINIMSYTALDINKNIQPFIQTKSLLSYPKEVLKNIKLLTFFPEGLATPFGSYIYRIQKYPGDLDLTENFYECCSIKEVIEKFIKSLKRMVKEIQNTPNHYFSEFKAGLDKRYNMEILGNLENGVFNVNPNLNKIFKKMFSENLFDNNEKKQIQDILKKKIKNENDYDILYNIIRNRRILRWSAEEILRGFKNLDNDRVIKLKDALKDHTHVKIDMIALVDGKFIEITNFVGLGVTYEDGRTEWINIDVNENHDVIKHLPHEIEKLYFSDFYYSPFKMVKRIYSLSRTRKDVETLNKIISIISSNVSLLYQIKSDIDNIILVLDKIKKYPKEEINRELDNMKVRLSNILQFTKEEENDIDYILDYAKKIPTKDITIFLLQSLNNKFIKPLINNLTLQYLNDVGLNPPPDYLLPENRKYSNKIRYPNGEILKNIENNDKNINLEDYKIILKKKLIDIIIEINKINEQLNYNTNIDVQKDLEIQLDTLFDQLDKIDEVSHEIFKEENDIPFFINSIVNNEKNIIDENINPDIKELKKKYNIINAELLKKFKKKQ
jgi:hypothetical protein